MFDFTSMPIDRALNLAHRLLKDVYTYRIYNL